MTNAAEAPILSDEHNSLKPNNLHRPHLQLLRQAAMNLSRIEECPEIFMLIFLNDAPRLNQHILDHPTDIELRFRLKTPLLVAIKHNSVKCFDILMKFGADMDAYNCQNETAIVIAALHIV